MPASSAAPKNVFAMVSELICQFSKMAAAEKIQAAAAAKKAKFNKPSQAAETR